MSEVKEVRRRRSYVAKKRIALAAGVATRSGGDRRRIAQRSQEDADRVFGPRKRLPTEMLGEYLSKVDEYLSKLEELGVMLGNLQRRCEALRDNVSTPLIMRASYCSDGAIRLTLEVEKEGRVRDLRAHRPVRDGAELKTGSAAINTDRPGQELSPSTPRPPPQNVREPRNAG